LRAAVVLEDFFVLFHRWILKMNLIANASEKRLIHQLLRLEIRREDDQRIKGQLELLASVQSQVVNPLFKWDNPPVQQILWADKLTSEIVNQEHSSVRLNLEGSFIKFGHLVV